MSPAFCRCRTALTAACTAQWPAELQLQQALGLVNTWLLRDQQLLKCLRNKNISTFSHLDVEQKLLRSRRLSWLPQAAVAAPDSPQLQSTQPKARPPCYVHRTISKIFRATQCHSGLISRAFSTYADAQPATGACSSAATAGLQHDRSNLSRLINHGNQQHNQGTRRNQQTCISNRADADVRVSRGSNQRQISDASNSSNKRSRSHTTYNDSTSSVTSSGYGDQRGKGWPADAATPVQMSVIHSSDSSGNGVHSSSSFTPHKMASGADVAYETYPLPSYQLDDQEQQSLDKAIAVINILRQRGFLALIVGGWVRDKYLGRRASDIDIATNATPWELRRLFRHIIELPRSTVKLHYQGEAMEVTSFRGISRAPTYFSVAMDAGLRDFTLNALYYDPARNEVLDFVGGVPDVQAGVLRFTADAAARLSEDPLRALRCVRFVTVLGLRLTPETAAAVRQAAHMCSVRQGLPPRRIWLELRKLHRAEEQQPGSWYRSLKLCYHLGLLQPLFPWLDAAGHAARQAVQVAEKLHQLWSRRTQEKGKQQTGPLSLLVAAMLHPASPNRDQAYQQLEQYFPEPGDVAPIKTLLQAAALTHNSSSSSGSYDSESDREAWVAVYASPYAALCLDILGAWMPEALFDGFMAMHQARMSRLADDIGRQRHLLLAQHDSNLQAARIGIVAAAANTTVGSETAAASEETGSAQQGHQHQQDGLVAADQELVGEQERQQQQQQQQQVVVAGG